MWIKVRKKPVVVDAILWDCKRETADFLENISDRGIAIKDGCIYIKTLEGTMKAKRGDWIIRGVKGELYPCEPDIFVMTYEIEGAEKLRAYLRGE